MLQNNKSNIQPKNQRRWISSANHLTSNVLGFNNPWIVFWWSMAFPGFGHLLTNHYLWAFVLITFEFIVNNLGQINTAIFYSMIGEIDKSKEILEVEWVFFYVLVYVFALWDSYRRCVDNNKAYQLAYREESKIKPFHFSTMGLNLLERRNPLIACICSLLMPGLGEFYNQRLPLFIFLIFWWFFIIVFSNIYQGIYYSMIGEVEIAKTVMNPQWLLFIPSIYSFSMYFSYLKSIEGNKIFKIEKANFLKNHYQSGNLDDIYD